MPRRAQVSVCPWWFLSWRPPDSGQVTQIFGHSQRAQRVQRRRVCARPGYRSFSRLNQGATTTKRHNFCSHSGASSRKSDILSSPRHIFCWFGVDARRKCVSASTRRHISSKNRRSSHWKCVPSYWTGAPSYLPVTATVSKRRVRCFSTRLTCFHSHISSLHRHSSRLHRHASRLDRHISIWKGRAARGQGDPPWRRWGDRPRNRLTAARH